jgi:hypothetical protein
VANRLFKTGLYLTKGGEQAIVDQVLSLWIDGYILAGRHGAKKWIKCRWYPDGRYREEDLSEVDYVDTDHLDLGVHLKSEVKRQQAEKDVIISYIETFLLGEHRHCKCADCESLRECVQVAKTVGS